MPEVIVIGGGVIGVSVAYRLAAAGASVTLLEANELASGTSATSFAWMNSNNKAPLAYHRLNAAGMIEHSILREEFGAAPWLHIYGNLIWQQPSVSSATEPDVPVRGETLDAKFQRLREWEYPIEFRTPVELALTHPDLALPAGVERVAFFPSEGYVDVPMLVANLALEAKKFGARIETNRKVVELVRQSGRVTGVRTGSGALYEADIVVSCTGRWTDQVTDLTGQAIPMAPTLGLLVVSSAAAITMRSLAHTPKVNVRPVGGSRFLLAGYDIDNLLSDADSNSTLDAYADEILDRAKEILPALRGSYVESYRVGVRSIPEDGFPVVGPIPGVEGFYAVATHSGVTMGPLLGRIAAKEILSGEVDDRLATFRPDRLMRVQTAVG